MSAINRSVVLGSEALKGTRFANECVVLGPDAGKNHIGGERNVFVGKESGKQGAGSENVYVGLGAGYGCQGSGNVFLGAGVSAPSISNTFMVGYGRNTPIVASFETGVVQIPILSVKDIRYSGELIGPTPAHILTKKDTNVGNSNNGLYSIAFGENTGTHGDYNVFEGYSAGKDSIGNKNVMIGWNAGSYSRGNNVVAIGEYSAFKNTGNNVICLGMGAGWQNTRDNMLFIGDFVSGDIDTLTVHRALSVGGWNISKDVIKSDGVHISKDTLLLDGVYIAKHRIELDGVYLSKNGVETKGILISPNGIEIEGVCLTRKSLNLNGMCLSKKALQLDGAYVASNAIQIEGVEITRSNITVGTTHITDSENATIFSKQVNIKGPVISSVDRDVYQNNEGVFVGTHKIRPPFKQLLRWNDMHVGLDKHVYVSTTGITWRPIRSPCLEYITVDGSELIGYGNGFYRYENHEWIPEEIVEKGDYKCSGMSGCYAFGTPLSNVLYEDSGTILFRSGTEWRLFPGVYPDTYVDARDSGGYVYVKDVNGKTFRLEDRKAVEAMFLFFNNQYTEAGKYPKCDLTAGSLRIGDQCVSSSIAGIEITDGIHTGKVYDSVFNTLPIHLDGIRSLTVKKNASFSLVFDVEDMYGEISSHIVGSPESSRDCR
jgi:hypothetical protein